MTLNQREVEQLINDNLPIPGKIRHIDGNVTIISDYTNGDSWSAIEDISGFFQLQNSQMDLSALTSIGGQLSLTEGVEANLPTLISIGNYLYLLKNSQADLSALTKVGGGLYICENVQVSLSALSSVGGGVYISDYTDPLPTQLRHLETREKYKLIYQAEDIANQVTSSGGISVIKRRASL